MSGKKEKLHYAWIILIACCLLQSAITGIVQNCRGIFYNPVCDDLGLDTSAFTLYSLFHGIASFLSMPFTTKLFDKVHPRLSLTLACTVFCGATALLGSCSTLPAFYLVGALQGAGSSLLIFYVCPLLINNWFERHYGFALGLYAAFSGLTGVIVNPILSRIIERFGWRTGYLVQGLSALAVAIPAIILIRSARPETLGMTRLGETGLQAAPDLSAEQAPATSREKLVLILVLVFTTLSALINSYVQHFAKYAVSIGLSAAAGALLVSCAMVGNIVTKFGVGFINDKLGPKKAIIILTATVSAGFALMLTAVPVILYPAAVLSGGCMTMCAMAIPFFVKLLYGPARYRKFYRVATMMSTLMSSAGITFLSLLYEIWYSYTPVLLIGVGMGAMAIGIVLFSERFREQTDR